MYLQLYVPGASNLPGSQEGSLARGSSQEERARELYSTCKYYGKVPFRSFIFPSVVNGLGCKIDPVCAYALVSEHSHDRTF